MSTDDWDLFLGPLEWARGFPGVARVNKVTPVSLGYPLLVFNKNSTLKGICIILIKGGSVRGFIVTAHVKGT